MVGGITVHMKTPCVLIAFPQRVGHLLRLWQITIRDKLWDIPTVDPDDFDMDSKGLDLDAHYLDAHFDSIDTKLSIYEYFSEDVPMLLELAIWKYKITEQYGLNNQSLSNGMKMHCRTYSVSMVMIIIPNVLYFLAYDDGSASDGDSYNYDDSNEGEDGEDDVDGNSNVDEEEEDEDGGEDIEDDV